ncbi:distal tail protein Dit [Streptococcus uberis]|uniref:distal tail protein Dit n=1 Tax=Streptococcus uberis TaxID=1349 RepID=UPI002FEDDA52
MTISMSFNNISLDPWVTVLDGFTGFGGADYDVELKNIDTNGAFFVKKRYKEKVLRVPVFIKYQTISDYDKLQSVLYVDEPQRLTFSHLPDRYFLAIPSKDLDFREFRLNGKGIITFIIPDGVAHSTSYKKITDFTESDGKVIFNITNNGNVEALPIITAKMNSENGYFGLVNENGVMEIGDREIIDSETRQFSERPFDYSDTGTGIKDGFTKGTKNVAILNDNSAVLDDTLSVGSWLGRDHLLLGGAPFTSGTHAGTLTFDLPAEGSLYDYFWWRQVFWAGALNQYGFIKIMISDSDGKFLYGVETIKRKAGLETEYNFMVTDGKGGYKFSDFKKKFKATDKDNENPFNAPRGWSDIIRNDDKVSIFWFGSRYERTFPELKGKKSAKLHIALGSINGNPLVTRMYVDGIKYRKDNVAFGYNIPNPYGTGSTVVINSENKTLLVDNIPKLNHVVDYSKWPKIPPGTSTLEITTSSWNEIKPTFSLAFEERWL